MRAHTFSPQSSEEQGAVGGKMPFYLGVDGGGSKCKARLVDADGNLMAEALAGPANAFQDLRRTQDAIVASATDALAAAGLCEIGLDQLQVGAGLAGINIPSVAAAMGQWQHPFASLQLETDVHIACLGAHGGTEGGIVVVGTGSVAYCYANGCGTSFGGHGFPAGDKGSGAWLGLKAFESVLLALDQLGPETQLLGAIESHFDTHGLGMVERMASARPREYAALAPLVLELANREDTVAVGIVREGADYLTRLAQKVLDAGAPSLCMLGGLAPLMLPWMAADIRERVVESQAEADVGAVRLAMYPQRSGFSQRF